MIKAVIFDFGRVITAQKPHTLFVGYEEELGLPPGKLNRIMFGSDAWQEVMLGHKALDDYWREIGPELGLLSDEAIHDFRQRYFGHAEINPGVLDLLHRLQGRYRLAVLSNAPPRLTEWLADWNILHLFDLVVSSGDVGLVKPDPAIYQLTLDRLSIAAREAIFIDDTVGHVNAARAVGIHGIHFANAAALETDLKALLPTNW
jgi:epoxide hydrolase-like predicted phosphatase